MKMIKRKLTYIVAAIACIAAVSCKKDTTIQYGNMTMGNVTEGHFVSDQGNIFNVVEKSPGVVKNLLDMDRAYIMCDVLSKTAGGLDNEYDIRLTGMAEVKVKDILTLGTEIEEEKLVEDPVHVEYAWFSGGYINLYVVFPKKNNSETLHMINLVQQETEKGYLFRLTHNSYGENLDNGNSEEYAMAGGYISFPISPLITEDSAEVRIEWEWYKSFGNVISKETETKFKEGKYVKGGFDHMPKGLRDMAKAYVR
jgi:hypothetical protein